MEIRKLLHLIFFGAPRRPKPLIPSEVEILESRMRQITAEAIIRPYDLLKAYDEHQLAAKRDPRVRVEGARGWRVAVLQAAIRRAILTSIKDQQAIWTLARHSARYIDAADALQTEPIWDREPILSKTIPALDQLLTAALSTGRFDSIAQKLQAAGVASERIAEVVSVFSDAGEDAFDTAFATWEEKQRAGAEVRARNRTSPQGGNLSPAGTPTNAFAPTLAANTQDEPSREGNDRHADGAWVYDVAFSFAGEDRSYVEKVAKRVRQHGVRVFYDDYETVTLWGKDLYEHLAGVYQKHSRYTVIFISKSYSEKLWTTHERKSAQARAFAENREYILPVRFDDTEIPGILPTIGYIDLRVTNEEALTELIIAKLGR